MYVDASETPLKIKMSLCFYVLKKYTKRIKFIPCKLY